MSKIEEMLSELARKIESAKKLPLTEMVLVNPAEILELIKAIKESLPGELESAATLLLDREQIILEAKEQAYNEYLEAAERNEEILNSKDLVKEAYEKKEAILKEAKEQAEYYIDSTLEWVDSRFSEMEQLLERNLEATKAGRAELKHFKVEK